jgi:large subunit ribosomal protein L10
VLLASVCCLAHKGFFIVSQIHTLKGGDIVPTQEKVETVAQLTDRMKRMQVAMVADYRGLTMAEMTTLRSALRAKGAEFIVAKNTLAVLAARETGSEGLEPLLKGPTALVISYDDIPGMAKAFSDFAKTLRNKELSIRGGLLGNQVLGPGDLERLVSLPTREQSVARVLGGVQAPASRVVGAISGVMRNIAYVLKAYSEQGAQGAEA